MFKASLPAAAEARRWVGGSGKIECLGVKKEDFVVCPATAPILGVQEKE